MGKVVFDITASLDGYVAGPNDSPELPMGEGGMRLFDWYFSSPETARAGEFIDEEIKEQAVQTVGVIVAGRRTYNNAHGWNGQHPLGVPVFVVTHQPPELLTGAFNGRFVTDGVESAIRQAQETAGDKAVAIASPMIAWQCLEAGLLDEVSLHIVPVLLGDGVPLFGNLGTAPVELECTQATNAGKVIHLTFRVIK
jgi:dihydrofolate reductase